MNSGKVVLAALAVLAGLGLEDRARADLVLDAPNPIEYQASPEDTSYGIQFTALQNATITAFDYIHES